MSYLSWPHRGSGSSLSPNLTVPKGNKLIAPNLPIPSSTSHHSDPFQLITHIEAVAEHNRVKASAICDAIEAQMEASHKSAPLSQGPRSKLDRAFDALKHLVNDPQTATALGTQALVDHLRNPDTAIPAHVAPSTTVDPRAIHSPTPPPAAPSPNDFSDSSPNESMVEMEDSETTRGQMEGKKIGEQMNTMKEAGSNAEVDNEVQGGQEVDGADGGLQGIEDEVETVIPLVSEASTRQTNQSDSHEADEDPDQGKDAEKEQAKKKEKEQEKEKEKEKEEESREEKIMEELKDQIQLDASDVSGPATLRHTPKPNRKAVRSRTQAASIIPASGAQSHIKQGASKRAFSSAPPTTSRPAKKRKATGPITVLPIGTLAASDGMVRVPGVKWPRMGDYTYEGVTKDIQCQACDGRLHWICAGFKDDEKPADKHFLCRNCESLLDDGQAPTMGPNKSEGDKCIRPSCIRRSHKKIIKKPEDVAKFMVEKPIGRRIVVPATYASRPEYEFLIKWWKYPLEESTWEPESSFPLPDQIHQQFLDAAWDEGVSLKRQKGRVIVLAEAERLFPEAAQ